MNDDVARQKRIEQAQELLKRIEADDETEVERLLEELRGPREMNLFLELGRLTRQLHESLVSFQYDSKITELAEKDIPDAKERLNYVISMTEQAANRTLDMVEASLPVADDILNSSKALDGQWKRFRQRQMSLDEFREFGDELQAFFATTTESARQIHDNLSEMLMAQGFQDLTGQLIRRVINLVHEVEQNMVGIIRISGVAVATAADQQGGTGDKTKQSTKDSALEGPQTGEAPRDDVVSGQDEVDDLLKSLGF